MPGQKYKPHLKNCLFQTTSRFSWAKIIPMHSFVVQLVFVFVAVLACSFSVHACKFHFPDVCQNVTCPNGLPCQTDTSYYCDTRTGGICFPVATCQDNIDPCKNFTCPIKSVCVKVKENCVDGFPCMMKAQCNVRRRAGKCPNPKELSINSCQNSCQDSDHMCEKNSKCCYSASMQRKFCVPVHP